LKKGGKSTHLFGLLLAREVAEMQGNSSETKQPIVVKDVVMKFSRERK